MAKKKITVEQIDAHLARWQTKLKRAVNTLERLQRMRKRLMKKVPDLAVAPPGATRPKPKPPEPMAVTYMRSLVEQAAPPIDTSIPDFLKRDDAVAEQLRAEQAETKKKKAQGRIAKMKAKQSGETRKMPLTGRAALDAIRNG
jgi:hypothetical protein